MARSAARCELYRRFSKECLEMARAGDDERVRAVLIQMAQVWFRLAEDQAAGDEQSEKN
jgi:hypothetical protein